MAEFKLSKEEFEQAVKGEHSDVVVNHAVIDSVNIAKKISAIIWQRAQIKAERQKNKALDERVVISYLPEKEENPLQDATEQRPAENSDAVRIEQVD